MAKYFKTPNRPTDFNTGFFVRSEDIRSDDYHYKTHPSAEIGLRRGRYEYGRFGDTDSESLAHNIHAKPGDQLKMFQTHPSVIESAFADHSMRSYTPTLLGMAINEATKIGTGLTYSGDLSEHSSKLAKKGIEAGVVLVNQRNTTANKTNDIGSEGANTYHHELVPAVFQDLDPVSDAEVKAGRETIRKIVKGHSQAKKTHMGPQFENTNPEGWYQPELGQ